ncbi:hypothetical protein A2U01_0077890, partial [Trifolium medium]|nr:hypothetical protein [Trifolium medium]
AEPDRPAGLPVFTGSAPVFPIFSRFPCTAVLHPDRTGHRSDSLFDRSDRPVRFGSDNLDPAPNKLEGKFN